MYVVVILFMGSYGNTLLTLFFLCNLATINESIKKDLLEHIKKFLDDNLE